MTIKDVETQTQQNHVDRNSMYVLYIIGSIVKMIMAWYYYANTIYNSYTKSFVFILAIIETILVCGMVIFIWEYECLRCCKKYQRANSVLHVMFITNLVLQSIWVFWGSLIAAFDKQSYTTDIWSFSISVVIFSLAEISIYIFCRYKKNTDYI